MLLRNHLLVDLDHWKVVTIINDHYPGYDLIESRLHLNGEDCLFEGDHLKRRERKIRNIMPALQCRHAWMNEDHEEFSLPRLSKYWILFLLHTKFFQRTFYTRCKDQRPTGILLPSPNVVDCLRSWSSNCHHAVYSWSIKLSIDDKSWLKD